MCPEDTTPEAAQAQIEILRRLTPGEKFARVVELIDFMRDVAVREIRTKSPGIGEYDLLRELARRRYGSEVAERAYPKVMRA